MRSNLQLNQAHAIKGIGVKSRNGHSYFPGKDMFNKNNAMWYGLNLCCVEKQV